MPSSTSSPMDFQEICQLCDRLAAAALPLRIFGYGSIVWSPNFAYSTRVVGRVEGYKRRFYQSSASHRGTTLSPGRVATLVPSRRPGAATCGVAFEIRGADAIQAALKHLIEREIKLGGYRFYRVSFQPCRSSVEAPENPLEAYAFIADPDNPQFLGRAGGLRDQARQIAAAVGPAGPNVDYVRRVAEFMRSEVPDGPARDRHVFRLLELVERCLDRTSSASSASSLSDRDDEGEQGKLATSTSSAAARFTRQLTDARNLVAIF